MSHVFGRILLCKVMFLAVRHYNIMHYNIMQYYYEQPNVLNVRAIKEKLKCSRSNSWYYHQIDLTEKIVLLKFISIQQDIQIKEKKTASKKTKLAYIMLGTFLFFAFHLERTHRHTCLFNRKHQVEGSKKLLRKCLDILILIIYI